MTAQTRATLFTYFETGDKPTQSQFHDLIDSSVSLIGSSAQSITSNVTLTGTLIANGAVAINNTLTVSGAATYTNNVSIAGNLGVTGTVAVSGAAAFSSSVAVPTLSAGNTSTNAVNGAFVNTTALTLANGTTCTTQTVGDNSTKVASTAFVETNAFTAVSTWTPVLNFGGAAVGITYSTQRGRYIKIGKTIIAELEILLSSKGSSTGNVGITGLPNAADHVGTGVCGFYSGMSSISGGIQGIVQNSTITLVTDGTTASTTLTNTNFGNTTQINITLMYITT